MGVPREVCTERFLLLRRGPASHPRALFPSSGPENRGQLVALPQRARLQPRGSSTGRRRHPARHRPWAGCAPDRGFPCEASEPRLRHSSQAARVLVSEACVSLRRACRRRPANWPAAWVGPRPPLAALAVQGPCSARLLPSSCGRCVSVELGYCFSLSSWSSPVSSWKLAYFEVGLAR